MDPRQRNILGLALIVVLVALSWWALLPWEGPDYVDYTTVDEDGGVQTESADLAQSAVLGPFGPVTEGSETTGTVTLELRDDSAEDGLSPWWLLPGDAQVRIETETVTADRQLAYGEEFVVGTQSYKLREGQTSITEGLDIQGGLSVILTARETTSTAVTDDVMDRAELIVRNRVDKLGASEATIQRQGSDSILVQLPGVRNAEDALEVLGSTGQLEFVDVNSITDEAVRSAVLSWDPSVNPARPELPEGTYAPIMTGAVITDARVSADPQTGEISVDISMNSEGAQIWAEYTASHVGQRVAIVLDGQVQSAPNVNEPIPGGNTSISGGFTAEEAKHLQTVLETGALPVSLDFSESRVVGPTLGQDSLRQGLIAALVGLAAVAVFMALFYRGLGVITWFSLAIFASLFLGVLSLLSSFNAFALSLPGIAGIVLTIGLAADSSILIFERFKEEVRMGKTYRSAAKSGTRHAILTSLDADLVTFVSALMLFLFAIGPVRGFALTLMIGICIDLTVAILFTRGVVIFLAETVVPKVPFLFGVKGGDSDA